MPRPKVPERVTEAVETLWAKLCVEARQAKGKEPSGRDVWLKYHGLFPKAGKVSKDSQKISLRKVQQIVAEVKKKSDKRSVSPPPVDEWRPWENQEEGPESAAYLLLLDAITLAMYRRHLYQHEADWAQRLRVALEGLSPYDQFCFVQQYVSRQGIADWLGRPLYTADLDAVLAYKPWLSIENKRAYEVAFNGGSIDYPIGHLKATLRSADDLENPELKDRFEAPPSPWARAHWMLAHPLRRPVDWEPDPFGAWLRDPVVEFWSKGSMFIPKELTDAEVTARDLTEDRVLELWSILKEDQDERLNSQTQPN